MYARVMEDLPLIQLCTHRASRDSGGSRPNEGCGRPHQDSISVSKSLVAMQQTGSSLTVGPKRGDRA